MALWLIILPYYLEFHGTDRFRNLSKLALYKVELKLECRYGNVSKIKKKATESLIRYFPNALMVFLWKSPVPA